MYENKNIVIIYDEIYEYHWNINMGNHIIIIDKGLKPG